jgi:hypothetical protein
MSLLCIGRSKLGCARIAPKRIDCGDGPSNTGERSVSRWHALCDALTTGGAIQCWGAGTKDACGGRSLHCGQATPPDAQFFKTLGLGWLHSYGVLADDSTTCWGYIPCGGASEATCGGE